MDRDELARRDFPGHTAVMAAGAEAGSVAAEARAADWPANGLSCKRGSLR